MNDLNTPAQIIISTILGLIGLGLGYIYLPALMNRIQKKREWERQREHGEWIKADIRTDQIAADQKSKGHRAPADVPPPNKGGDNE